MLSVCFMFNTILFSLGLEPNIAAERIFLNLKDTRLFCSAWSPLSLAFVSLHRCLGNTPNIVFFFFFFFIHTVLSSLPQLQLAYRQHGVPPADPQPFTVSSRANQVWQPPQPPSRRSLSLPIFFIFLSLSPSPDFSVCR